MPGEKSHVPGSTLYLMRGHTIIQFKEASSSPLHIMITTPRILASALMLLCFICKPFICKPWPRSNLKRYATLSTTWHKFGPRGTFSCANQFVWCWSRTSKNILPRLSSLRSHQRIYFQESDLWMIPFCSQYSAYTWPSTVIFRNRIITNSGQLAI